MKFTLFLGTVFYRTPVAAPSLSKTDSYQYANDTCIFCEHKDIQKLEYNLRILTGKAHHLRFMVDLNWLSVIIKSYVKVNFKERINTHGNMVLWVVGTLDQLFI